LNNIGSLYESIGENRRAIDHYNQALLMMRELKDRQKEAAVLSNIAGVYHFLGEEQAALDLHNESLELRRAVGDRRGEANTLQGMGLIYNRLNDKKRALDYHNQALLIWQGLGDKRGMAGALNNLGSIYHSSDDKKKALDAYGKSLTLFKELMDPRGSASALTGIGTVYGSMGQNEKALDYFEQSLPMRRAAGDQLGHGITLFNMGLAYYYLGDAQKALDKLRQSLDLVRRMTYPAYELNILYEIARVEHGLGNPAEARSSLEAAIEIIESLRTKVASPELRSSYFASVQNYYELYIDVLMTLHQLNPGQGYNGLAFQASERARARVLLEMLSETGVDIREGVVAPLLERERSIEEMLHAKAEQQSRPLTGKRGEMHAEKLRQEIAGLLDQYQDVRMQIRAASPRYAALTQPRPLSLKQIQREVLDPDTLLLEYSLGEKQSYLWLVTGDSLASFELPGSGEIESLARRFYQSLARRRVYQGPPRRTSNKRTESETEAAASELSHILLKPVAGRLGKKRLLLVLDGVLHYVPFAALPAPPVSGLRDDQRPLVMDHEIINLPSASTLAVLRREVEGRQPSPKELAVLADPVFHPDDVRVRAAMRRKRSGSAAKKAGSANIARETKSHTELLRSAGEIGLSPDRPLPRLPFSRVEAEAIHAITGRTENKKALDFDANRAVVTSPQLSQYRIVHFATHGLLNNEHPELSGLALSMVDEQGRPQNGFFRLYDIYNLNLRADLVVLSACHTALGKQIRGEGIVGVTRGFMYAGAASVLASVWRVEDEATSEFMKRFYEAMINRGLKPPAALREAQTWMRSQKRWRAPYFWAGFVIQGDWK
jgi:CHAT domain-containing protein/tetratricopeptide (TPR) repeat protein